LNAFVASVAAASKFLERGTAMVEAELGKLEGGAASS
jgi:hypothetical protein